MATPANYAYWIDTVNFGKPKGDYYSASYSQHNETFLELTFHEEEIHQATDMQLTNQINESIINTE
jgi:hypothetical protein